MWLGIDAAIEQRLGLGFGTVRIGAGPRVLGTPQTCAASMPIASP